MTIIILLFVLTGWLAFFIIYMRWVFPDGFPFIVNYSYCSTVEVVLSKWLARDFKVVWVTSYETCIEWENERLTVWTANRMYAIFNSGTYEKGGKPVFAWNSERASRLTAQKLWSKIARSIIQ